jgi:hypothetical protein
MNDLLVIVPSRGRPQNVKRLIEAMGQTCTADTTLLLGLDRDDRCKTDYLNLPLGLDPPRLLRVTVESDLRGVVPWINHLAVEEMNNYRFIGTLGDDNLPRTDGWDTEIIEALERQPFAFADDLHPGRQPGSLACHIFMRAEVIRKLGYMGPPSLAHMYVDNVWHAWGEACGMEFLKDTIIEHLHPSAGKAESDEGYGEADSKYPADTIAFAAYRAANLNTDIAKIKWALRP